MALKTRGGGTILNYTLPTYEGVQPLLETLERDDVLRMLRRLSKENTASASAGGGGGGAGARAAAAAAAAAAAGRACASSPSTSVTPYCPPLAGPPAPKRARDASRPRQRKARPTCCQRAGSRALHAPRPNLPLSTIKFTHASLLPP
jgi:hypothetical protein